jgi:RHH-type proline utilization regulon transcriptional repressor/proline dehydrogenase/delta 1-pyrroline-5-carboxylate dehydrogenase
VGQVELASVQDAETAVQTAKAAYTKWSQTPAADRAQVLLKLADIFRRERMNLAALQVYEVGKTWSEADGDACEAIDFCTYYAEDVLRLARGERVSYVSGEDSRTQYRPRGVSLVIAPWNFPLAILTGQVVASIVTGNTCVMKPAEQSSIIAARLMQFLEEAGCPKGVVNFVPGLGEEVGRHLVAHKDVAIISFTGSMAVGLEITKQAAIVQSGQHHVKRCIIEMGGKNAVIVDSDADLDEAVAGVIYSAFGFQGQKCSACSRVIVLEENYDRFLERLIQTTRSLHVRVAHDPAAFMGPVVDQEAYERILNTVEKAKSSARLVLGPSDLSSPAPQGGYFIGPHIFADVNPNSELAQEEIFGPVLAVIKVKDLDEALQVANGTKYALTGGLFSRSPANIERIRAEYDCGNLYINRGITGAMVGRHPFGGYKMSGLGSKTGGKDYLAHYCDPRTVTENTLRRGFAPTVTED